MIVSHEHKFIFIKTGKTAGTSVECGLSAFCGPDDIITPVSKADEALRLGRGPQNWDENVNPWWKTAGRKVGLFKGRRHKGHYYNHMPAAEIKARLGDDIWRRYYKFTVERNPWDRQISIYYWRQRDDAARPPFAEFMRNEKLARGNNFYMYSLGGAVAVDRICRYENLAAEVQAALAEAGLKVEVTLPRAKGGSRKSERRHYRDYYDDETRETVARWYADEIRATGYEF
ncbi:MAG: sulfotransferase family 2 domain-containing protein [Hyphomicrobiales bacterium]|nr:sulfotransferase family 2 domain-containing protein [Hyphomicrobiales bacterium]